MCYPGVVPGLLTHQNPPPLVFPLSDLWGTAVLQQLVASATGSIYFPHLSDYHWPQRAVIVLTTGHVAEKENRLQGERQKKRRRISFLLAEGSGCRMHTSAETSVRLCASSSVWSSKWPLIYIKCDKHGSSTLLLWDSKVLKKQTRIYFIKATCVSAAAWSCESCSFHIDLKLMMKTPVADGEGAVGCV